MIVTERRVSRILVVCIRNSKDVATFPSLHIYQIFQSNGLIEIQSAVTSHAKNLANAPIGSSCRNALMTNLPDICRHKRTARAGVGPDRQRRIDSSNMDFVSNFKKKSLDVDATQLPLFHAQNLFHTLKLGPQ